MAKSQTSWVSAKPAVPPNWLARGVLMLLVLALLPLVIDGIKVCISNWMTMHGRSWRADTPAFDTLRDAKREIVTQAWQIFGPLMRDPPWSARTTIVLAAAWALVVAWILRHKPR